MGNPRITDEEFADMAKLHRKSSRLIWRSDLQQVAFKLEKIITSLRFADEDVPFLPHLLNMRNYSRECAASLDEIVADMTTHLEVQDG